MKRLRQDPTPARGGPIGRTLAWSLSAVVCAAAAIAGGAVAVVLAAGVVIMILMATLLMVLGAAVVRARRLARAQADPNVIEARHVGGHSWVAYGWDGRR